MHEPSFTRFLKQQEDLSKSVIRFSNTYSKTLANSTKSFTEFNNKYSKYLEAYDATFGRINIQAKHLSNFGDNITFSLNKFYEQQQNMLKVFQRTTDLTKYFTYDSSFANKYADYFSSVLVEEKVTSIDVSGIEEFTIPGDVSESTETEQASKKKLADMTEAELERIIKGAITKAGKFSVLAFIGSLFAEYVVDAAKVIMEIMIAFILTFSTGQYNDQVKAAIQDRIDESMVVKDVRKVITKYVKFTPTDEVAFLRKESFIRLGPSKSSPVAYFTKFSKNTVFTVVERRNNWIKVEIIGGELDGDRGWVEESKIVKFKEMNY